jgi:hypothetical protein
MLIPPMIHKYLIFLSFIFLLTVHNNGVALGNCICKFTKGNLLKLLDVNL